MNKVLAKTQFTPSGTAFRYHVSPLKHNPCIVFIHGVGLNLKVWQPQIDYFGQRYHVLTFDMLGHGQSPLSSANPTLIEYAEQLHELICYLKEHGSIESELRQGLSRPIIVGHSMGALIAIEYALKYADHVRKVVALNIVFNRTDEQSKAVKLRASQVLDSGSMGNLDIPLRRWFDQAQDDRAEAGQSVADRNIKMEQVRTWLASNDILGYGRTYALFSRSDQAFEGQLQSIKLPVLYLTGDNDLNSTPYMSEQMAALTPNAKVGVLKNQAHMMAYASPERVNVAIDNFLKL